MARVIFELPDKEKDRLAEILGTANMQYRKAFRGVIRRWIGMTEKEQRTEFLDLQAEFVKTSIEQKRDEIAILEQGLQKG